MVLLPNGVLVMKMYKILMFIVLSILLGALVDNVRGSFRVVHCNDKQYRKTISSIVDNEPRFQENYWGY